ncbi:MAG TPA: RES family NAD+ phosphorylase [Rubrivivax sp.]|nr:RES family NAD+ phosphorylase [Burkholderiales bacterium]HNU09766.1 RES family NAD+ phosphorylase [Rubrivivax sp.]
MPTIEPERRRVRWPQACRILPTRYPAVTLFDRVADAADFDALYALEAMTNERVRDEVGQIQRVPPEQRRFGPGSGPIMAAFTHVNLEGSRFSDGSYGVFYAARERATAIAETRHHHARFLQATAQPPMHLPMRLYHVVIDASLHDLRPRAAALEACHDPDSYVASRALAARLRAAGSEGVVYRSVRHSGGQCVGLFSPLGARDCLHAAYLLYAWDGQRFTDVYERLS